MTVGAWPREGRAAFLCDGGMQAEVSWENGLRQETGEADFPVNYSLTTYGNTLS